MSYALLEYITENLQRDTDDKIFKADNITFGYKLQQDVHIKDKDGKLLYIKPKGTNTAYACATEARFQQDKVIDKSLCIPYICLDNETINNDIAKIKLDDTLSQRTINFVNRFKLLYHQPNTSSGFSATLFQNKQTKEYILSFRGTELSTEKLQDTIIKSKTLKGFYI